MCSPCNGSYYMLYIRDQFLYTYITMRVTSYVTLFRTDSIMYQLAIGWHNQLSNEQKRCISKQTHSFVQNLP